MARIYQGWAKVYASDMRKRFVKQSRGAGEWAPLKESTKLGRMRQTQKGRRKIARIKKAKGRRGKMKPAGKFSILWNEGTLIGVLDSEFKGRGGMRQGIRNGIRVGFGGSSRHPKGRATISDIARFHQSGNRRKGLPRRRILVDPSRTGIRAMNRLTNNGLRAAIKAAQI